MDSQLQLEIRPMAVTDVLSVHALLSAMEGTVMLDWETPAVMTTFIERCPRQAFVALTNGVLIGCAFLSDGMRGFLHHVAVYPGFRERKVATRLVQALLADYARRTGVRRIQIVVLSNNSVSLEACRNSGARQATAEGGRTIGFVLDLP